MRWVLAALWVLSLSGCERTLNVPDNVGVCWRLAPAMNGQEDFKPLASGVENLETCAVKLEGLYLLHRRSTIGGYQGRVIYVDAGDITAAAGPKTQRYRVFTPAQRTKIDAAFSDLRRREALGE